MPREYFKKFAGVALEAYKLMCGNSYGRVDMRSDADDLSVANVFVLEVNSQVSFSVRIKKIEFSFSIYF